MVSQRTIYTLPHHRHCHSEPRTLYRQAATTTWNAKLQPCCRTFPSQMRRHPGSTSHPNREPRPQTNQGVPNSLWRPTLPPSAHLPRDIIRRQPPLKAHDQRRRTAHCARKESTQIPPISQSQLERKVMQPTSCPRRNLRLERC